MLKNILLVGFGGAIGAMLRYGITLAFTAFHWSANAGTFLTNVVGSFCMGILVSVCAQSPWLLMLTVGVCGGFTTFSTFSLQAVMLLQAGKYAPAVLYIMGSVLCCLLFAAIGYWLGQRIGVEYL